MKRIFILAALLIMMICSLGAETVSLGDGNNSLTLLSASESETVLQYQITKFEQTPIQIEGNQWFQIRLPRRD